MTLIRVLHHRCVSFFSFPLPSIWVIQYCSTKPSSPHFFPHPQWVSSLSPEAMSFDQRTVSTTVTTITTTTRTTTTTSILAIVTIVPPLSSSYHCDVTKSVETSKKEPVFHYQEYLGNIPASVSVLIL